MDVWLKFDFEPLFHWSSYYIALPDPYARNIIFFFFSFLVQGLTNHKLFQRTRRYNSFMRSRLFILFKSSLESRKYFTLGDLMRFELFEWSADASFNPLCWFENTSNTKLPGQFDQWRICFKNIVSCKGKGCKVPQKSLSCLKDFGRNLKLSSTKWDQKWRFRIAPKIWSTDEEKLT